MKIQYEMVAELCRGRSCPWLDFMFHKHRQGWIREYNIKRWYTSRSIYLGDICIRYGTQILSPEFRVFAHVLTRTGEQSTVETLWLAAALVMIYRGIQVLDPETAAHETEKFRCELCADACEYTRKCTEILDPVLEKCLGHVDSLHRPHRCRLRQLGKSASDY